MIVQMERVLITGGTGFLGTLIAAAFVEAGFDVTALDVVEPGPNFPAGAKFAPISLILSPLERQCAAPRS
jgi:nucleoside-diphosphate-sugar epimerase